MQSHAWMMLGILTVMFALLIWNRFPAWLLFLGTLTACMTLKLASAEGLLKGFSNPGVLTVAALFPVAAGMYATGAISLSVATNDRVTEERRRRADENSSACCAGQRFPEQYSAGSHDDSGRS